MLKIEIVDHCQLFAVCIQGEIAVGRKEYIRFKLFKNACNRKFEPDVKKNGMPCLRSKNERRHIIRKKEFLIRVTVEQKDEVMLRMGGSDPFQGLIAEPPDAFELVF